MTAAEYLDLFEYNRWANGQALDVASGVTAEQYITHVESSFTSLRATLQHMLAVEIIWLSRWEGHSLGDAPDFSTCHEVSKLGRLWQSFWNRQFGFLSALSDEDLARPIAIRTRGGIETVQTLGETLTHVVNHSTYHRGQVATIARQVGGTPLTTDYFTYCLGKSG